MKGKKLTVAILSALMCASLIGGTASAATPHTSAEKGTVEMTNKVDIHYKTADEIAAENNYNDNPFGLVYRGAITKNEAGKVNIHPISYMSRGLKIAANVYTPAGWKESDKNKYAAIVVAHPNGGVKEQVAGLFAQRMAEKATSRLRRMQHIRARAKASRATSTSRRRASRTSIAWRTSSRCSRA